MLSTCLTILESIQTGMIGGQQQKSYPQSLAWSTTLFFSQKKKSTAEQQQRHNETDLTESMVTTASVTKTTPMEDNNNKKDLDLDHAVAVHFYYGNFKTESIDQSITNTHSFAKSHYFENHRIRHPMIKQKSLEFSDRRNGTRMINSKTSELSDPYEPSERW